MYSVRDVHQNKCFGCGPLNSSGIKAPFSFNEKLGEVNFKYMIQDDFSGAPGYAHGGVLSALVDEAQGVACHCIGHLVMTDRLRLKYHKAVPVEEEIIIRARVIKAVKKRLYTKASIESKEGIIYVDSSAVFYIFGKGMIKKIEQEWSKYENRLSKTKIREFLEYYKSRLHKNKVLRNIPGIET